MESLRNRIDELKRKKIALRDRNAHMILQVQRYKGLLSQPPLDDGEKKQLRVLQKNLDNCAEKNRLLNKELEALNLKYDKWN